jgi:hypothetical protein
VKGSSTTMPPTVIAASLAAGGKADGQRLSSTEYTVQEAAASTIQPSPTVNRTVSRRARSPCAMTSSTPATAQATAARCAMDIRSPSSFRLTTVIATGVTA